MGEKEYKETLSQDAYDESEFDQLSSDNARRGRKKKHRDSPDVLNNNISNPLPPPGKRKKYFKNKRQECTTRVDPEERREEIVGHEANALPPSTEEPPTQVTHYSTTATCCHSTICLTDTNIPHTNTSPSLPQFPNFHLIQDTVQTKEKAKIKSKSFRPSQIQISKVINYFLPWKF